MFIVSFDELDNIIKSPPHSYNESIQKSWQHIRGTVGFGANYYSAGTDVVTLTKLISDLGAYTTKVTIREYSGKLHIILKGEAGLRKVLTGTKYGINNPKIISMGLGKAGATAAVKQGGILTIILLTSYRVIDYFLTDTMTLTHLIGTLATDVVKVGISVGASLVAVTIVTMISGATTIAIGPLVVVIFIGVGSSYLLEIIDKKLEITNSVIQCLDEINSKINSKLVQTQQQIQKNSREIVAKTAYSVINYAIDYSKIVVINWARNKLTYRQF